ncbi:YdbL family protein [bacterium]|nr:YdbL family protein [bacterium]
MRPIASFFISLIFFVTSQAQYKILEMSPPGAKKYLKSQLGRMDEVRKHKFAGHIGEADGGLLAIHEIKSLPKADQEKIKKLVESENKDRQGIFAAVAKHNKLNSKEKEMLLRSAFETYRNMDAKGVFYFENKKWQKKY